MTVNVGDEVLVAAGLHWMEHGRVCAVDRTTYQHPFVTFNCRSQADGRLILAERMVPEKYCASFGPGVTKKCPMCENKTLPGKLTFFGGRRTYCGDECAKKAALERLNQRRKK